MNAIKKLICKILGHKWKYNFPNTANKAICSKCKVKLQWNFNPYEDWIVVNEFKNEIRTDEELIKQWF